MTSIKQREFTCELIANVQDHIFAQINDGKIPINWDGVELREYVKDCFQRAVQGMGPSHKRLSDYRNDIIVHNL